MRCPNCGSELAVGRIDRGEFLGCPKCGGRAVTVALLRRILTRDYVRSFWAPAIEAEVKSGRKCPTCERSMLVAPAPSATLDLCKHCQLVWFDPNEFDGAPAAVVPEGGPLLPQEALEAMSRIQAQELVKEWKTKYPGGDLPDILPYIPAVLGVPLEEEEKDLLNWPWVSWALIFILIGCGAVGFLKPALADRLGFVPSEPFRLGGVTLITSFFLHAGVFGLLANVYFLLIFGDNVEDYLGRFSHVLLLLIATMGGELVHALFAPERNDPLIGAGAGISGVIVFYSARFPTNRLRYFKLLRWFSMPASTALAFWIFSQVLAAREQLAGSTEAVALSHIGGALVGLWFWFMWRRGDPAR